MSNFVKYIGWIEIVRSIISILTVGLSLIVIIVSINLSTELGIEIPTYAILISITSFILAIFQLIAGVKIIYLIPFGRKLMITISPIFIIFYVINMVVNSFSTGNPYYFISVFWIIYYILILFYFNTQEVKRLFENTQNRSLKQ